MLFYGELNISICSPGELEGKMRKNGQEELIPTYRKNSLWLQSLSRKDGLEYARRCPHVEGFILWSWIDFHQYAEGVLDDFWQLCI